MKFLIDWLPDISIFAGITLLATGLYMIYMPLAFVSTGIFMIYLGWPKGKKVK
jgi:hypothetical protein